MTFEIEIELPFETVNLLFVLKSVFDVLVAIYRKSRAANL